MGARQVTYAGLQKLAPNSKKRIREDGRQSLLVYMDADLVRELKKAAIDEECNAYEIVEVATKKWLAERGKSRGKAGSGIAGSPDS